MSPVNLCFLVLFLILSVLNSVQASTNQTKAICYSGKEDSPIDLCNFQMSSSAYPTFFFTGSNLYQLLTQDCNDKDSSYTGEWFCAKMEVSEIFSSFQFFSYLSFFI